MIDELGGPNTYNHYPNGWAMAFNTPFKMWKRYEFNGGTCDPCIISWPAGIEGPGRDPRAVPPRDRHRPDDPRRARRRAPRRRSRATCRRASTASACATASTTPPRRATRSTQFYSMLGSRAIWHEGWKAVTTHPTIAGWSHFNEDEWELYHTDVDRSELHNLAAEHPEKVRELVNLWFAEAGANGAFPLDDRSPSRSSARRVRSSRHRATATSTTPTSPTSPRRRRSTCATAPTRSARSSTFPAPGAAGCALRPGLALRRPRPLRQGEPAALRLQLRRQLRADGRRRRGAADGREPDPLGRPSRRTARTRRASPRACSPSTTATEGRRGAHQDPARHVRHQPAPACTSGAARPRSPTTTPESGPGASRAGRSSSSPSTSAASPTSTWSARPRRCSCASRDRPPVVHPGCLR